MGNIAGQSGRNFFDVPVFNALVPKEGPKAVPVSCPFTSTVTSLAIDFTITQAQQFLSIVQGCFIDNSKSPRDMHVICAGTNQEVICPAYSQGYFPLLASKPTSFTLNNQGAISVTVFFYNVPVPAVVWNVEGSGEDDTPKFTPSQTTVTTTATLLAASGGKGMLMVNAAASGGQTIYVGPDNTVTAASGYPVAPGGTLNLDQYDGALYGVTSASTALAGVMLFG